MILELREQIEVETPLGRGDAIFVETGNDDHFWTVILRDGAIVTFRQAKIRVARDYTRGRGISHEEMAQIIKNKDI